MGKLSSRFQWLLAVFLILILTCPAALARVDIACSNDDLVVTVSYDASTEPNGVPVRAFALDITVDSGAIITDVNDNISSDYYIYPGSITIVDGNVTNYGTAVCANSYPGTLNGLNTGGVTVEMGALYDISDSNNAPGLTGDLITFTVDTECCVTIAENTIRAGVVSETYTTDVDVNAPGYCVVPGPVICLPDDGNYVIQRAEMQKYHDAGYYLIGSAELDSWCTPYQCDGDASVSTEGYQKYRVFSQDALILGNNWKTKLAPYSSGGIDYPAADPRADLNHDDEGYQKYRVFSQDALIMGNHWKWKDTAYSSGGINYPAMPGDCPRPDGL